MTVQGKIHHIGPLETVGANGFTKRLLVVNNGQQYDNLTPIEFVKDKASLMDSLQVGQDVTVGINLGGREYNGKYYPSVRGWKIDAGQAAAAAPVAATVEDDTDSLPF